MKNRGRPRKENSKTDQFRVRLDAEDRAMMEHLSVESGMSMSEILRRGLRIQYDMARFSH